MYFLLKSLTATETENGNLPEKTSRFHFQNYYSPPLLPKCYESFFFPICLLLLAFPLFALAEEQAQQRLQAEKAEKQYQTVLRQLNATTRKTQKKE